MNIKPTGHHVIIKLLELEKKTPGGIILPTDKVKKEQAGGQFSTIIAVGDMAWSEYEKPWAKVGDIVVTVRYPGAQYDHDGEDKYNRIINDDEIIGVLEQ